MWYDFIIKCWVESWKKLKAKDFKRYEEYKVLCGISDEDIQNPNRIKILRMANQIEILSQIIGE